MTAHPYILNSPEPGGTNQKFENKTPGVSPGFVPETPAPEEPEPKREKSFFDEHKWKIIAAISGILLTLNLAGKANPDHNVPVTVPVAVATANPGNPGNNEKMPANMPKEAQDFVNKYSDRYGSVADTYSVYLSNESLVKATGKSAIMSDEFIEENIEAPLVYDFINNPLGFVTQEVPSSDINTVNQETSMKIFNDLIIPNANIYMNEYAKNLYSEDAINILGREFLAQMAGIVILKHSTAPGGEDYEKALTFMKILEKVALVGGSNSTCRLLSASNNDDSVGATMFNTRTPTRVGHNDRNNPNLVTGYTDSSITCIFEITTYDGDTISTKTILATNCQFSARLEKTPMNDSVTVIFGADQPPYFEDLEK